MSAKPQRKIARNLFERHSNVGINLTALVPQQFVRPFSVYFGYVESRDKEISLRVVY